jgi:hemolysin III
MVNSTAELPLKVRLADEIANAITHGLGLALSLIGVPILVMAIAARGDALNVAGASVFGASLVALYAASTLYHAIPGQKAKRVLRIVDHIAIFLLIAGTYTPFTLGVLRGTWGWTLFGLVWGLAALGIVFKLVLGARFPAASTAFYLAMGWVAIFAVKPLMHTLPTAGLILLGAGGLLYTVGVIFFVIDHRKYMHAVWHLFVLGGSACHFVAILKFA